MLRIIGIYDRAKSSGKSISHFIVDSILSDWRYKKPTPRLTPRDRTAVVTDLEKAVMTNSITNVKEALSLYAGDSDMLFASGRVKCIYKDNICR